MTALNIQIDPLDQDRSLTQQITDQIRVAIKDGYLLPGEKIPASRQLAVDLGVARGTVTTAVEMLLAEGVLEARTGAGTFVSEAVSVFQSDSLKQPSKRPLPLKKVVLPDIDPAISNQIDFRPCRPSISSFPLNEWRRCSSLANAQRPSSDYGDPRGSESLRKEIEKYLRRARGLQTSLDDLIVTNGSINAMHLIARVIDAAGKGVVIEDPGYPLARQVFQSAGHKLFPLPVDQDGLIVSELEDLRGKVSLIYVTPSHQFPVGSRLSLQRRYELIQWAREENALIIEDDYDGEFRYDVPALVPLAALAPDAVVYCGTFSKTLFPGLRIGFAAGPNLLIRAMTNYRAVSEYSPPLISQSTLKNFIELGYFERHVQRIRKVYRAKRKKVVDVLDDVLPSAIVSGISSGLSTVVDLPDNLRADRLKSESLRHGILIEALPRYSMIPGYNRNSVVIGYAEPDLKDIERGLTRAFSQSLSA